MHGGTEVQAGAIRRARSELNKMQRVGLGPAEAIGDVMVAIGVPILLWSDVPPVRLLLWGAVVGLGAYSWEIVNRLFRDRTAGSDSLLTWFGWITTFVWGALPWLVWPALDDRGVVWILVFVVSFAIATDTIFVTQTSSVSLDEMVLVYSSSYLLAFALNGAFTAVIATIVAGATFSVGGAGLGRVAGELVTQRAESERRTRIDDLTGVGNRSAATEAIAELIESGATDVRCAFFDLDDFKQLNDNFGYAVGDAALRIVAELLVEGLPADWTVARFGGDEFVAVGVSVPDLTRIVDVHMSLPTHGGLVLTHSLSVGMTKRPSATATADSLFQEGAAALRMAKRLGKRQVVEMTDELRAAERLSTRLGSRAAAALEGREIVPWAQHIVNLESGDVVGIELLARWPQPDGTMVMPDQFVPVIEEQGRGPALGLLMVQHAIDALASPLLRDSDVYVSVNLSAKHLFHRRLPNEIGRMLEESGVAAHRVVVEITESQHLPNSPIWRDTAHQLRKLGVGLAIDDFGTGYSSLEQLLSMPFSHLKVDRVMTRALSRPGAAEMAAAIVAIATGSGMVTIVEGIETECERAAILATGCRYGQGYLFARPAPLADLMASACRTASDDATLTGGLAA